MGSSKKQTMPQCEGKAKNGSRCKRTVLAGGLCHQHKAQAPPKAATAATYEPEPSQPPLKKANKTMRNEPHECAICMETDLEDCRKFSCGHTFHVGCIENLRKCACPLCRKNIRLELPVALGKKISDNIAKDKREQNIRYTSIQRQITHLERIAQRTGDWSALQTLLMSIS